MKHQITMNNELYYEFRQLSTAVKMSGNCLCNISKLSLRAMKKNMYFILWPFIAKPKLVEKLGPNQSREWERVRENNSYLPPPLFKA